MRKVTFLLLLVFFLSFMYYFSENVRPSVVSFSIYSGATNIAISTSISVSFNKKIYPQTVTTNTENTLCSGSFQVSSDSFSTCVKMSSAPIASNDNRTFTIIPASNLTGSTNYTIRVTSSIEDEDGYHISQTESTFTTINKCGDADNYCYIFVSSTSTDGGIDVLGNDNNTGLEEADDICNNDANKINNSNYKAMITHVAHRRSSNPSNWVLQASTEYRRTDNTTIIGTTNVSRVFSFPLTAAISSSSENVWTGLESDWNNAVEKCTENSGSYAWNQNITYTATYGVSDLTSSASIDNGTRSCSLFTKLYCVEQP